LLVLIVAGAIALRVFAPSLLEPRAALEWLRSMSPLAQVAAYLVAYVVVTTLAVPAFVMAIVAGVAWGLPWGLVLCYFAANVASNFHFFLGRSLGAERISAWLAKKGVEQRVNKNTFTAMLVLRAMPVPFLIANVTAGAAGVRWPIFLFGSGLGLVPQVVAFTVLAAQVYAGVAGAEKSAALYGAGGIGVFIAMALVSRWLRNRAPPPA
jgi:uncharacterized membrane protein YdjX (TVP38/TMEM64 family)